MANQTGRRGLYPRFFIIYPTFCEKVIMTHINIFE